MHHRTSQAVPVVPEATVLPFPGTDGQRPPENPERTRHVETTPAVGYNAITLTYYDDEHVPRIQVMLDLTVPDVDWWRRFMKRVGDELPPVASGAPILGPRLLP